MFDFIDNLLNRITMYRLVLYALLLLVLAAVVLSGLGVLSYNPVAIVYSTFFLVVFAGVTNWLIAKFFRVPTNYESAYITALILALIISPPQQGEYLTILPVLGLTALTAMAAKFVVSWRKKHLFNPAAFAVVLTAVVIGHAASWWVGTAWLVPVTVICGLLIVRKLRQFHLLWAFLSAFILGTVALVWRHGNIVSPIKTGVLTSPLLFLGTIMLTEPLTMPPQRWGRLVYGFLVGILVIPQARLGRWSLAPEQVLLVGNLLTYIISPKERIVFTLESIRRAGDAAFDFVFKSNQRLAFVPGQYMEWTLGQNWPDSRGNRRYFTIASSPTEKCIILGVKFYGQPSSFKHALRHLHPGQKIIGGQLAGEFVLPHDPHQKLAFLAGGIGITPFRSMTKYLLDTKQPRDIVLIYSNRSIGEIAYRDVFAEATEQMGLRAIYTLTETAPTDWPGYNRPVSKEMIAREIPDFQERLFYISGSHGMVTAFKRMLRDLGVPRGQIKTDFFPGLV